MAEPILLPAHIIRLAQQRATRKRTSLQSDLTSKNFNFMEHCLAFKRQNTQSCFQNPFQTIFSAVIFTEVLIAIMMIVMMFLSGRGCSSGWCTMGTCQLAAAIVFNSDMGYHPYMTSDHTQTWGQSWWWYREWVGLNGDDKGSLHLSK